MPLGPEATRELLGDLLGRDPSLDGLAARVHERSAGNPFFVEEIVQSLVESGVLEGERGAHRLARPGDALTAIPGTVQAILAARIDRLPEREKRVLETASVIGRTFSEVLLGRVVDLPAAELADALRALTAAEFVYEEALYPAPEYSFKHPLTQEVAYGTQLGERRRATHAGVAGAIEALDAGRLDERAAVLAYHWEAAGDDLRAARWHRRAAEWTGLNNPTEALRHWRRVRELAGRLDASDEARALRLAACGRSLGLGVRLGLPHEEREALYAEGTTLARETGDAGAFVQVEIGYATAIGGTGDIRGQLEHTLRAEPLAERSGDPHVQCFALNSLAFSHRNVGRLADALAFAERSLAISAGDLTVGRPTFGASAHVFALWARGAITVWMGRLAEGRADIEQAITLGREAGEVENLGWALGALRIHAELSGELGDLRAHATEALALAERLGSPFSRSLALQSVGVVELLEERWEPARALLEQALSLAREHGTALHSQGIMLAQLARARLGVGDAAGARAAAEQAEAGAREVGAPVEHIHACVALAQVLLADGGAAEAARIGQALDTATALVGETGARGLEPQILLERVALARLLGDDEARRRRFEEAHRLCLEIGATGHAARLVREQGT